MKLRKHPDLFKPPGRSFRGPYEPEPAIQAPKKEGAMPKLVGDTVSCRKEIGSVGGAIKYCPYECVPGTDRCTKHPK